MTEMPPPGEQKLRVSIEVLRQDAAVWDDSGDIMRRAAQVAARLDLAALHFSYIGDKVGLVELYRQLQDRMIRLLSEGSETCETIATSLRSAADGYERDEAANAHDINNIY
ncbi:hypothetical protein [Micromonospora sp. NPDC049374]|uniref:hypothetical protein n=1 Tax=Micromonospora sp. NPDC049374 TaxID=3154352 RepID=UPI00342407CC